MWLYIPASFLSAPASEDSISESDWRFQALERSVSWRGSTRSARSWRLAWTKGRLTTRLFTRICDPSTAASGVAAWISSLPATLASLSRLRGSGEGRRTSATSGLRSCESLARWDPASSSWRMSQATFGWDSTEFSETLPTSGSMRSGALYGRPMLERLTEGSGSSCWPTATTQDNAQVAGQYATNGTTLAGAARVWLGLHAQRMTGPGLNPASGPCVLSPRFVEWLMGYPRGWTASAPSATPSSPSKPRTHSEGCSPVQPTT